MTTITSLLLTACNRKDLPVFHHVTLASLEISSKESKGVHLVLCTNSKSAQRARLTLKYLIAKYLIQLRPNVQQQRNTTHP